MTRFDGWISSALVAAALLVGSSAYAQTTPPTKEDMARAKELFDAGAREYEAGRFEGALQAFEQAFKIVPRDGIMFSMAQAHRRQYTITSERKHLSRAAFLYKQYIDKVKSGARVADAVKALGELAPLLATMGPDEASPAPSEPMKTRIVVNIVVPGTRVSIDGGPPKDPPINEEVKPGPHVVRLTAPGYFDEEREIPVGQGEIAPANLPQRERPAELDLVVDDGADVSIDGRFVGLSPLARTVELPSGRHFVAVTKNGYEAYTREVDLDRAVKKRLEVDLDSTVQRDSSYIVLGTAGVFGATALVFGGLVIERESVATNLLEIQQTRPLTRAEANDYERARKDRALYTQIGFGIGGGGAALLILGTGLLVFDKPNPITTPSLGPRQDVKPDDRDSDVEMSPTVSLSPGLMGAGLTGTF